MIEDIMPCQTKSLLVMGTIMNNGGDLVRDTEYRLLAVDLANGQVKFKTVLYIYIIYLIFMKKSNLTVYNVPSYDVHTFIYISGLSA